MFNRWRDAKKKFPKNSKPVLVCNCYGKGNDNTDYCTALYSKKDKRWYPNTEMLEAGNYDGGASIYLCDSITHWKYLKAPKWKKA